MKKLNLALNLSDLGVKEEDIEETLINLNSQEKVIMEEQEEHIWVYLNTYYFAEKFIAQRIIALNKADNLKKIKNFKAKFKIIEEASNIFLSQKQKEAIEAVNENNVCVITGGPGTGKTTIIKFIIDLFNEQEKKKVVLCAPTRKSS